MAIEAQTAQRNELDDITDADVASRLSTPRTQSDTSDLASVLFDIAQSFVDVASTETLDLINRALGRICAPAGAEFASLFNISVEKDSIVEIAHWDIEDEGDIPPPIVRQLSKLAEPVATLHEFGVIRLEELPMIDHEYVDELSMFSARSVLVIPLDVAGEATVMIVGSRTRSVTWVDSYVDFAQAFGSLVERVLLRLRRDTRINQVFEHGPLATLAEDWSGRIVDANPAYLTLVGVERGATEMPSIADLAHPDDRSIISEAVEAVRDDGQARSYKARVLLADGLTRWVRVHCAVVTDPVTAAVTVVSVVEDVTELHRQGEELARSEERFRGAVEAMPALIVRLDLDGVVQMCSPEISRMSPVTPEDLIGESLADLMGISLGQDSAVFQRKITEVIETGERIDVELSISTAQGVMRLDARAVPEFDENGEVGSVLVMALDVTEQTHLAAELAHAATHDTLTGIACRSVLASELETHLSGPTDKPPTLLFIDLDYFKVINDSMGHNIGDEVLRVVAKRIESHVRPGDRAARLGGDEFAVLSPGLSASEALVMADRLRTAIEAPIVLEGATVRQTVSIGVACADVSCDSEALLHRADQAMYAAKTKGRNRCEVFDEGLLGEMNRRSALERELFNAVERNEMTMHFQPEVRLRDGHILGVEALLRWDHPRRGIIDAEEFIGVAEASGMMHEIGRFVIEESIARHAEIAAALGRDDLGLRTNLSAPQFVGENTVDLVRDSVEAAGLDPSLVCLEMTESVVMTDPALAMVSLERLRRLGIQLAIDDFGVGYSSLANLRTYPFDWIKIDKSFVADVHRDNDCAAIVEAVVKMAAAMDLGVVAEGVEHEAQARALLDIDVTRAQGLLFSKALPKDELIERYR